MTADHARAIAELVDVKAMRLAVAATGAGAGLQQLLWSVPGISTILEEAIFPYSEVAIRRFLCRSPGRMLQQESAIALACAAYLRAQEGAIRLAPGQPPLGVGISAAVATNRVRRGPEQLHFALRDSASVRCASVELERGKFSRQEAGKLCDRLAINAILSWAGMNQIPGDSNTVGLHGDLEPETGEIILRQLVYVIEMCGDDLALDENGAVRSADQVITRDHLILPSSLNPFHFGHDGLAQRAVEETGRPVIFELSLTNVDKPELDLEIALRRAIQLRGRWPLLITRGATLFVQKARRYGCSFIVGLDTAERIVAPQERYNEGRSNEDVLEELSRLGTRFFVAERGNKRTVANLCASLPNNFRDLFVRLTGRWEISSTELR